METWAIIALAAGIAALVVLAIVLWAVTNGQRSKQLRSRYGREYDLAVAQKGGRRAGERELAAREKRVEELELRPLPSDARNRYRQQWRALQGRFVEDPSGALQESDRLINSVLSDRGFPQERFLEQEAALSTKYPRVMEPYRKAHAITQRDRDGDVDTEDQRLAVLHYRTLFDELLNDGQEERAA